MWLELLGSRYVCISANIWKHRWNQQTIYNGKYVETQKESTKHVQCYTWKQMNQLTIYKVKYMETQIESTNHNEITLKQMNRPIV